MMNSSKLIHFITFILVDQVAMFVYDSHVKKFRQHLLILIESLQRFIFSWISDFSWSISSMSPGMDLTALFSFSSSSFSVFFLSARRSLRKSLWDFLFSTYPDKRCKALPETFLEFWKMRAILGSILIIMSFLVRICSSLERIKPLIISSNFFWFNVLALWVAWGASHTDVAEPRLVWRVVDVIWWQIVLAFSLVDYEVDHILAA